MTDDCGNVTDGTDRSVHKRQFDSTDCRSLLQTPAVTATLGAGIMLLMESATVKIGDMAIISTLLAGVRLVQERVVALGFTRRTFATGWLVAASLTWCLCPSPYPPPMNARPTVQYANAAGYYVECFTLWPLIAYTFLMAQGL